MPNPQTLDNGYETIQVFPIHKLTVQGVQTDLDITNYKIVHADEDCTLTFKYDTTETVVINVVTGEDVGIVAGFDTLTSSGIVKVS